MGMCEVCGAELRRRHQKRFCSNRCQGLWVQQQHLQRWLTTGQAVNAGSGAKHYIRLYLDAQQGSTCALCKRSDQWEGQTLVLILDHIDGDSANNHRDNLRLVCPNCDSQLPTYKARNRGRGRAWRRARYAAGGSY